MLWPCRCSRGLVAAMRAWMQERFDIFCSYAHVDGEAVRQLVEALEAGGLAVYLDSEELVDFESITGSIRRGLACSKALLAYYSAIYSARRACQWELTAAFPHRAES